MILPKYRCHKEVHACRILEIRTRMDGSGVIIPDEPGVTPIGVSSGYLLKHRPTADGYYVRYSDGYESFSPKEAFEEGYARVNA